MRGCRACRILLAGHRFFVRKFSASVASSNRHWCELFEEYFGKTLQSKSTGNQLVGSAAFLLDISGKAEHTKAVRKSRAFLLDISGKAEHTKAVRKKFPQEVLSDEELQLFEDLGPSEVFKNLIDELSLDHAVLLCTKLPANHLNVGMDTLIRLLLERVQQNDVDEAYHRVLGNNIVELFKQSKSRNCTLSKETDQKLQKWLQNCMHSESCQNFWQLQYQESVFSPQAKKLEKTLETQCTEDKDITLATRRLSSFTEMKDTTLCTRGTSSLLKKLDSTDLHCKTNLPTTFSSLGKSVSNGKAKKTLLRLQELQKKGMPEKDMKQFIKSFTKALTEVHPNSTNIKRSIEAFKRITTTIQLNIVESFNLLIAHCANHGEIDLCVDLIQTMKARALEPCASSYEPLIRHFSRTLEISKAEDILRIMELSGMRASAKAHTSLIVAHARTNNLERAYNLIEGIPCEDLTADFYTPIIHAYGVKGQLSLALSVFHQMKKRNVNPNGENFVGLIRACAFGKDCQGAEKVFELYKKQGKFSEEEDTGVMAAMLRVYAECGDLERLEKMTSSTNVDLLVTPVMQSAMLKGLAETGRVEEALKCYNDIRNGGRWPDSGAFSSLLWCLGIAGELDQLLALFEHFRESVQTRTRLYQEEMMSIACSRIVHGLILHNDLEGALTFLQRVQLADAGDVETLCLKVFMEDKGNVTIIQRVHLALKDKLQFLQAMRERLKIQPTRLAYESLLESCAKEKDAYHAEAVLGLMRSDKLELNMFTYLIMLRIVICRGDLRRANVLASEMRRTMSSNGLMDSHVKFVINNILQSGNGNLSMGTLYS